MPPDKTWRKRYLPRLIIDLEGRPDSGGFEHHSALFVVTCDELKKLTDALEEHLLDSFHTFVECDEKQMDVEADGKSPDVVSSA